MPSRQVVESGLGRVRLQPVASPTSGYEQPTSAENSDLGQLAAALSQVSPELATFGVQQAQRKGERDEAAGKQEARELYESGKSWREAIKQGLITPDKSPWFRHGAEEQMGHFAAENFASEMTVAFAQSEYVDSHDPKDFDKFAQGFMKTWAAANLPDVRTQAFNTGFATADEKIAGARAQFADRAGENLIKSNRESFGGSVYAALSRITAAHGSMDDMAVEVQRMLDTQIAQGLSPMIANNIVGEAFIRVANETKNPAYMQIMRKIKAGPTSLFDKPAIGQAVLAAEEHIYDRRLQEEHAEQQRATEADRVATDGIMSAATSAIRSNPTNVDLDPFVKQLEQHRNSESNAATLLNLKRTYSGEKFAGDQMVANELLAYAVTVTDEADPNFVSRDTASKALIARRINQQDFNNVISLIERRENEDHGKVAKVLRDPVFVMYTGLLKGQFGSELSMPGENRLGMMRAVSEQTAEYLHWRDNEGKSASDEQKLAFLKNLTEQKRVKFGGMLQDMKDDLTKGVPQADVTSDKPEWKRGPVASISQNDWLQMSFDFIRGGNSADSLSDDQINKLTKAGATPATMIEFITLQLQFNGISVTKPAAATKR